MMRRASAEAPQSGGAPAGGQLEPAARPDPARPVAARPTAGRAALRPEGPRDPEDARQRAGADGAPALPGRSRPGSRISRRTSTRSCARRSSARGFEGLYTPPARGLRAVAAGKDVVVVTPTASGKTLCYNLPVLDRILKDPDARALYLFPTKALSQDQLAELHATIEALGADIGTFTYDGDTPQDARKAIRARAHVVVTNPDMLHKGILPHHTKWVKLVREPALRRDRRAAQPPRGLRLARGEHPPAAAAAVRVLRLAPAVHLLLGHDRQPEGAGRGADRAGDDARRRERRAARRALLRDLQPAGRQPPARHPPVGPQLARATSRCPSSARGCRRSSSPPRASRPRCWSPTSRRRSRRSRARRASSAATAAATCRSSGARSSAACARARCSGVVSTNALELGIDIGSLDAAVLVGYPGSVASAWQQAGRAGRRTGTSVAVLVANSTPLNQFIAKNPDYFFGAPVEQGRINPDNLQILVNHVKCAAFELPFVGDERFGKENLVEILKYLEEEKLLHRAGERWHWTSESYPADAVSLRRVSSDNFVVQDVTRGAAHHRRGRLRLGAVDGPREGDLHPGGPDLLRGEVRPRGAARPRCARPRSTTTPTPSPTPRCASSSASRRRPRPTRRRNHGEVHVTSQVVGFKKIKFHTNENVGSGELHDARERDAHDRLLADRAARDHAGAALLRSRSGATASWRSRTRSASSRRSS